MWQVATNSNMFVIIFFFTVVLVFCVPVISVMESNFLTEVSLLQEFWTKKLYRTYMKDCFWPETCARETVVDTL